MEGAKARLELCVSRLRNAKVSSRATWLCWAWREVSRLWQGFVVIRSSIIRNARANGQEGGAVVGMVFHSRGIGSLVL